MITEKLAQGGMGEVYLARHELMEREAVIKVLHPKLSHDSDLVARFLNEAKAAAQIGHPGIVQIFELATNEQGRAYIAMERLRGETLAERIKRGPMTVDRAVALTRQLASALGAAHAKNIVHRDLKPENIFVVPDSDLPEGERIKVLDFGVAKLAQRDEGENLTAQGSIFGTPAYMAPEQCADAANVDHRADLYAIGCILYELLCGVPPFGRGGLELLAAHLRDKPRPPSTRNPALSEDLDSAVLCLLAKDPDERFQSCEALIRALGGADLGARSVPPGSVAPYAATLPPQGSLATAHTAPATHRSEPPVTQPTTYRRASGQIASSPASTVT
ncbi:MAG: serine/threonine-protein kinase, partial [Myxococcota bacterium]